ncbi:hypothetical protein [Reichenbachiella agariperforans]|uniref:hypothetical protein n=1 Tax=Reichenbachiella agariperforans TaxID=156994 RepID=UPI001C090954|nr:hypothetical protein [Reichenbachiella agariperforans]MBU2915863.1 hypothetical protein [Reichenbachiella agariperforans]
MKIIKNTRIIISCIWLSACALKPATSTKNGDVRDYKYAYISQTNSLTSSTGVSVDGNYYSTSKSVNPRDIISGILAKEGFVLLTELRKEKASETLIVNYGESGRRNTGMGSYAIEVTIQFISSESSELISSCTAEGRGETEADDIRKAISRCLNALILE